jgi:hypothetical protein
MCATTASISSTANMMRPSVHGCIHGANLTASGVWNHIELDALPIGCSQHGQRGSHAPEPDELSDRRSSDHRLTFEPEAELDEERLHRLEIVDHDQTLSMRLTVMSE